MFALTGAVAMTRPSPETSRIVATPSAAVPSTESRVLQPVRSLSELGMLRAVGLTRRQTRRMVRHESVITALIGAGLGPLSAPCSRLPSRTP
jgi:hypothetical protein